MKCMMYIHCTCTDVQCYFVCIYVYLPFYHSNRIDVFLSGVNVCMCACVCTQVFAHAYMK